ncbi:hypothetical protein CKA55_04615 [Arcobacter suis]|uniref:Membrane protein n=1 Tax=Arcobacter suis CECT 7833 TaxID=663365 RepID=A0AAD0WQV6_9BACT|nr:hypothetical protein [Arcobacter suis]AXX90150.1 putative membrane protein [Arcobacter suis CECT 7833]RWS47277.1 hypothetical protein CKA55_04615 [Arcobacter suis]
MIKNLLAPIFVGLIILYAGYILTNKSAELKYTLSEGIPTTFIDNDKKEIIQQLTILNTGNDVAKNILVRIDASIENYTITKYSLSDESKVTKTNSSFEILYPLLPIDGKITYIFKTSISGINDNNLKITYDNGKAEKALESNSLNISNIISTIVMIIYFILILREFLKFQIENLKSKSEYENYFDFLNKKKPFYIGYKDWYKIREKYIKNISIKNTWKTIEEYDVYKILNQDMPNFITKEEWSLLTSKSIELLDEKLKEIIDKSSFATHESLLLIKKPKLFPEQKWQELEERINKNFVDREYLDFTRLNYSDSKLIEKIKKGQPKGLSNKYWEEYNKIILDLLYLKNLHCVLRYESLNSEAMKYLPDTQQNILTTLLYRLKLNSINMIDSFDFAIYFKKQEKVSWIKDEDYNKLLEKANKYIELDKNERRNEIYYQLLKDIAIHDFHLTNKPESIEDAEWNKLKELENSILNKLEIVKKDSIENNIQKRKNKKLQKKLSMQLKILNDFFDTPDSINRIEDYDNPFSVGTFERLKEFSKKLS